MIIHARRATFRAGALALLIVGACLMACSTTDSATAGPSCTNGTKDDGEEGLDCGGVCPLKCTGAVCAVNTDCGSGQCTMTACAAPAGKTCGVGAPIPKCNDGDACELDKDCTSGFCSGNKCAAPAAGSHSDGVKNGGETGIDCGGSVKDTKPCPDGQGCMDSTDCVGTCAAGICGPISHMDGKKNLDETDIDCGGATAPKCVDGKDCAADVDCATGYCPADTKKCVAPTYSDGVLNGTETDLDCGGTGMGFKACAQGLSCKVDTDCNGACTYLKKCVDMPSCKNQHGGDTCGTFETGSGIEGHVGAAGALVAGHEDCCRTLEVKSYADPIMPAGKTKVYLDKYEITAGRMRAFLEAIGGGADAIGNAKDANVRAWMAAHRPARWEPGWEEALPTANDGSVVNFTVSFPTVNLLYPGQDQFMANHPTQADNGWWIGNAGAAQTNGQDLARTVDVGVFWALGAQYFFPEYYAKTPPWASTEYAASHALNCTNEGTGPGAGSYGYSTYWFDQPTITAHGGGTMGKYFSKSDLDEKALNCSPNALFAAFCVWDGGQLATAEVMDRVTGNTVSPIYDTGACQGGAACQNGKIAIGMSTCGGATHKYITYPDGGSVPCSDVYYYPNDNGHDYHDGSSRIAPPGRIPADFISDAAADEPWMDLIGNLQEVVYKKGETKRFDYRGYGTEWSSIQHHHNQQTTPRNKGGSLGARCMRFK